MKRSLKMMRLFFCLAFIMYYDNSFSQKSIIDSASDKADLIIFSFDRPLQLYALLESVQKYIIGIDQATVIYRASNNDYDAAYETVQHSFPGVIFVKQGNSPKNDFKPLTLKALLNSPSKYIVFAVDDIVVKDYINMGECIGALKQVGAYGFYLRLGKNLTECYSCNHKQRVPPMTELSNNMYAWQFSQGEYDWRYPNTVDMTIYRKEDIAGEVATMQYYSPNTFEGTWAGHADKIYQKIGLCYGRTKIVNLPLNLVQHDCQNRHMDKFTPLELLDLFTKGLKMAIDPLFDIDNKAAHMEYEPIFVAMQ